VTVEQSRSPTRFPIRIGSRSRPLLLVIFGVRERNSYVELTHDELVAQFGYYGLRTPLDNIARWRIEGPWLWITALGVRRGLRLGDITFGGNHKAGVRLDFKGPIHWHFVRVPRLYVTVSDPEGLSAALTTLGIEGEDARRPASS
jgi:hypothetical protein